MRTSENTPSTHSGKQALGEGARSLLCELISPRPRRTQPPQPISFEQQRDTHTDDERPEEGTKAKERNLRESDRECEKRPKQQRSPGDLLEGAGKQIDHCQPCERKEQRQRDNRWHIGGDAGQHCDQQHRAACQVDGSVAQLMLTRLCSSDERRGRQRKRNRAGTEKRSQKGSHATYVIDHTLGWMIVVVL